MVTGVNETPPISLVRAAVPEVESVRLTWFCFVYSELPRTLLLKGPSPSRLLRLCPRPVSNKEINCWCILIIP